MNSWRKLTLGEVINLKRGYDLPAEQRNSNGSVPIVSSSGISGYHDEFKVTPPGVITGRYGTTGNVFYITEPYWPLNTTLYVEDFKGNEPFFVYYLLQTLDFKKYSAKTSVPGVNRNELHEILVSIPPLAEQRKIAAILSTWDEAITLTVRLLEALRQRKQALMQLLLSGEVRFNEFAGEEWAEVEIGEAASYINRPEPVNPTKDYRLVGVRWYVAGVHIHEIRQGSEIITKTLSRIQKGDVLYNKMWVSKAAFGIAQEEHEGAYGTSEYPTFEADPAKLVIGFMGYLFHDPQFQYEATSRCRGTTGRIRLNPDDFLKIIIQLPSVSEQSKIADTLTACDQQIDISTAYLENLKQMKRGLMQQLLTGAIRVQVDE